MHTIDITFVRATDPRFIDLMDAIGVYSLWSPKAAVRPSYIGEGIIFDRMREHMNDANKIGREVFDGFIGITGYRPSKASKVEAVIVEALLLWVANDIDRFPAHNKKAGIGSHVDKIFRSHGTLRLNIRGGDPLLPPGPQVLAEKKQIVLRKERDGISVDHDWNRRPVRV